VSSFKRILPIMHQCIWRKKKRKRLISCASTVSNDSSSETSVNSAVYSIQVVSGHYCWSRKKIHDNGKDSRRNSTIHITTTLVRSQMCHSKRIHLKTWSGAKTLSFTAIGKGFFEKHYVSYKLTRENRSSKRCKHNLFTAVLSTSHGT